MIIFYFLEFLKYSEKDEIIFFLFNSFIYNFLCIIKYNQNMKKLLQTFAFLYIFIKFLFGVPFE